MIGYNWKLQQFGGLADFSRRERERKKNKQTSENQQQQHKEGFLGLKICLKDENGLG